MDIEEINLEEKKKQINETIRNIFKKKSTVLLILILFFSFIIYMYYFNLTKDQALWWDEAEYMAGAKALAFGIPYDIHVQRPILFSFLGSLLARIGFGELGIKFLLSTLPGWLCALVIYLLAKEMYKDKKIALISAFIMSIFWMLIFYSMRIMTDSLSLLFGLLALLFFWKGYVKKQNNKYIWFVAPLVVLSFLTRLTGIYYGVILILFLFITEQFKFLKNKHLWISFLISMIPIALFLLWEFFYHGNALAFMTGYSGPPATSPDYKTILGFIYTDYTRPVFFIFFLVGIFFVLINVFFSLDLMLKKKDKRAYANLFLIIIFFFILLFTLFAIKQAENRWLIAMAVPIFIFSAKGIVHIYNLLRKNTGKSIAVLFLVIILFSGAYLQIKYGDLIIKSKIPSYSHVKELGLWLKENSNPDDVILSLSLPQLSYYSERRVYSYSESEEKSKQLFDNLVKEYKPRYLTLSGIYEMHLAPKWIFTWPQENPDKIRPVHVIYADETQQQAIFIVYEFIY